jgi:hypothetical protein
LNKQERWFWSVWDLKSETERVALAPINMGITDKSCSLYSRKRKFAKVHYMNSATIGIETNAEWSDIAGITHTSEKKTPDGWYGKPSVWWYISVEDSLELMPVLVKLVRARTNYLNN